MQTGPFLAAVLGTVAGLVGAPAVAAACTVCLGAVDAPMTHGLNNGILILLGVIGVVQIGFVTLFLTFRHRAKRLREDRGSLPVVPGGMR